MNLKIIIDRFEGDKAVLKLENGDIVVWPKNKLPAHSHEGSELFFSIMQNQKSENNNKQLAKNILNEILNINND